MRTAASCLGIASSTNSGHIEASTQSLLVKFLHIGFGVRVGGEHAVWKGGIVYVFDRAFARIA